MPLIQPKIIADSRENNDVKKALVLFGCEVVEQLITPADYILSDDCAVERKRVHDFLQSTYDGRLFEQVERMARTYKKPVLVVEGDLRSLDEAANPAVFWGALARVVAEQSLTVVFTVNLEQTALFLYSLAKKIREGQPRRLVAKHKPRIYTLRQRQLLTIQSLPHVGPKRAEHLLQRFGSVRRVFQASPDELLSTEGLGKKTVHDIRELLDTKYPGLAKH